MFLRISYTHDAASPRYPGNPENQVKPVLSFTAGDTCNAAEVCLFNHNGTHIDLPNHYCATGRRLSDYEITDFVFGRPILVRLDVGEGQPITGSMLRPFEPAIDGKDLLLLKTGFGTLRYTPAYANNPYLTKDGAEFLRGLKNLRALGVDFMSVTNPRLQSLGDDVHRMLLDEEPDGKPVLIIEDLDLSEDSLVARFDRVFAVPLFVEGVDGMPCTVFGEYRL